MIKLEIKNWFELPDDYEEEIITLDGSKEYRTNVYMDYYRSRVIYDKEKWANGKVYEFNSLKEVALFMKDCSIKFDNGKSYLNGFDTACIELKPIISDKEDNLIILDISCAIYNYEG